MNIFSVLNKPNLCPGMMIWNMNNWAFFHVRDVSLHGEAFTELVSEELPPHAGMYR